MPDCGRMLIVFSVSEHLLMINGKHPRLTISVIYDMNYLF
jgi:hypothetical protein